MRRPVIAVIGSSTVSQKVWKLAYEVGQEIAAAECHLICGGRGGVMEAACRGHQERRGEASRVLTFGILPGTAETEANESVDIPLPTGIGLARNAVVVSAASAIIAIAGGSGTLSEIALAWQFGKPIVALQTSGGWAEELSGAQIDTRRDDRIAQATTPREALAQVLKVIGIVH